ncbi:MAG: hypothetical protein R3B57_06885 [Phycisphaerales bacterium]
MSKAIVSLLGVAGLCAVASADLQITEAFVGLDGEDGTADWFEVTWTGVGTFDTGTLWYDDDSADFGSAVQLSSIILNSGDSAVFLIGGAGEIATFASVWGAGGNIGLATGGAGLGQSGDAVTLFDGGGTLVDAVNTVGDHTLSGSMVFTFQYDDAGVQSDSVLGVNGAYESNQFFNDNLGVAGDMISIVGSPANLPTPGALALLGLGGLTATRRRR